jgi:hypothetical protein
MFAVVFSVHAVVKEMEKRAQEQKEVGDEPEKVGPVLGEQEKGYYAGKNAEHN